MNSVELLPGAAIKALSVEVTPFDDVVYNSIDYTEIDNKIYPHLILPFEAPLLIITQQLRYYE